MKKVNLVLASLVTMVALSIGLPSCGGSTSKSESKSETQSKNSNGDVYITTPKEDADRIAKEAKKALENKDYDKYLKISDKVKEMYQLYFSKGRVDEGDNFVRLASDALQNTLN